MPKTKHITVRIIFKTSDQLKFSNAPNTLNAEWNIDISKNCN